MQIKVTTYVKNLSGVGPLLTEQGDKIPLRAPLLNVLINTLDTPGPNGPQPEQIDGDTKVQMFKLAQRIERHATVDLTAEDITLLKDRIAKAYPALMVGRVWEMLDPASVNGAKDADEKETARARGSKRTTKKTKRSR